MIKHYFLNVLENYEAESTEYNRQLDERKKKKGNSELSPNSVLSKQPYPTAVLLANRLPEEVRKVAKLRDYLMVKGSVGNGYMPEVPHVCIFDKAITQSAQQGYYIVYLFHSPARRVYLSLNQGFTEYRNKYGDKEGRLNARHNAVLAQKLLRSVEGFMFEPLPWKAKGNLAEGYKNGNICYKEYNDTNFPDDTEFVDDLRNLIGVYRELKGLVGLSMFQINDAISESQYQEEIQGKSGIDLPPGPRLKKNMPDSARQVKVNIRDPKISSQAIINASYRCENNLDHQTFTTHFGHPFAEAHHFIPLAFQDEFTYSLDVPENILSLCPNCHRAFHHANFSTRQALITKFWSVRKDQLNSRGLFVSIEKLTTYYKIVEAEERGETAAL